MKRLKLARTAMCGAAAFVACAMLPTMSCAQSREETEKFIVSNGEAELTTNVGAIVGTFYYKTYVEGCSIRRSEKRDYSSFESIMNFNVRDVIFTPEVYKNNGDLTAQNVVWARCISGKCISSRDSKGGVDSHASTNIHVPSGMHMRVGNALMHLQTLCGGPTISPF